MLHRGVVGCYIGTLWGVTDWCFGLLHEDVVGCYIGVRGLLPYRGAVGYCYISLIWTAI